MITCWKRPIAARQSKPQGIFWAQCFACEDHLRDFSLDHGPCSGEDCVLETSFGDTRIANKPLHSVVVVRGEPLDLVGGVGGVGVVISTEHVFFFR